MAQEPEVLKVADLDPDRVYWGLKDKPAAAIAAGDVVFFAETIAPEDRIDGVTYVEGDCDLGMGRYRWSEEDRTFKPLEGAEVRATPSQPSLERAFFDLALALRQGGFTLPSTAAEWTSWYANTVDNR